MEDFFQTNLNPSLPFSTESFIEHNGQLWLDARTIGEALGYEDNAAIFKLYERNQDELEDYTTTVSLTAVDGKEREQRIFNEEGIYIISMLARTDRAKLFRRAVAKLLKKRRAEMIMQAHQKGIYDGVEQVRILETRLRKNGKDLAWLHTAVKYHRLGLSNTEVGKLTDTSAATVSRYISLARPLGYLE